jgi:hypothetical protein
MMQLVAFVAVIFGGLAVASPAMEQLVPQNLILSAYVVVVGLMIVLYEKYMLKPHYQKLSD